MHICLWIALPSTFLRSLCYLNRMLCARWQIHSVAGCFCLKPEEIFHKMMLIPLNLDWLNENGMPKTKPIKRWSFTSIQLKFTCRSFTQQTKSNCFSFFHNMLGHYFCFHFFVSFFVHQWKFKCVQLSYCEFDPTQREAVNGIRLLKWNIHFGTAIKSANISVFIFVVANETKNHFETMPTNTKNASNLYDQFLWIVFRIGKKKKNNVKSQYSIFIHIITVIIVIILWCIVT